MRMYVAGKRTRPGPAGGSRPGGRVHRVSGKGGHLRRLQLSAAARGGRANHSWAHFGCGSFAGEPQGGTIEKLALWQQLSLQQLLPHFAATVCWRRCRKEAATERHTERQTEPQPELILNVRQTFLTPYGFAGLPILQHPVQSLVGPPSARKTVLAFRLAFRQKQEGLANRHLAGSQVQTVLSRATGRNFFTHSEQQPYSSRAANLILQTVTATDFRGVPASCSGQRLAARQ